jgi:hypothetical protein
MENTNNDVNTVVDATANLGVGANQTAFTGTVQGSSFLSNGGVRDTFNSKTPSGAYDHDGVDDEITIDNRLALGGRQQFTVHLQFAPDTNGFDRSRILAEGSGGQRNNNASIGIFEFDNNQIGVEAYDPNGNGTNAIPVNSSSTIVGQFSSLTVTFDTGSIDIFQDGSRIDGFATGSSTLQRSSLPIGLGFNNQVNSQFFDGRTDDLRIYNRVVSGTEIQTINNNTKP